MGFAVLLGTLSLAVPAPRAAAAHPGRDVAAGAHCAACHASPELAVPVRTESCSGCHQWVRAVAADPAKRAKARTIFPNWDRYEKNVVSYFGMPDLAVAFARLDPKWVRTYLADPHDVRPTLDESMVRVGLDAAALDALTAWAAGYSAKVPATPAPDPAAVATGERLFTERACAACHTFGSRHLGPGIPGAPDLRWARQRMTSDMIAAWIANPAAVAPGATMPALGLTEAEARALRDYVVLADPDPAPVPVPAVANGEPAPATPTWTDVEARVFGKICVHCHMDPAQNEGRAGPGNAGGFGWAATGIELQTYEGVRKEQVRVLAALERRYAEEARDHVRPGQVPAATARPPRPGMPMGQPALPLEDYAMVKAWYAAGAPR